MGYVTVDGQRVWHEVDIPLDRLGAVAAPVLVLQGDRDIVTVDHSLDVVRALPGGRLAVLPGTHLLPLECPDLVSSVIIRFLDAPEG